MEKGIANNCLEEDAQGVPLELKSALQYHSGFVQSVLAKEENEQCGDFLEQFRKCAKGESPNFIEEFRVGMKKAMMKNLIAAGIPILVKAKGVGRNRLTFFVNTLITEKGNAFLTLGHLPPLRCYLVLELHKL